MNPVTGTGRGSVDIGVNANVELVDKFCYLGDILSVDGDADGPVGSRASRDCKPQNTFEFFDSFFADVSACLEW